MKHDNGLRIAEPERHSRIETHADRQGLLPSVDVHSETFQQAEGARSDHDLPGPSAPLIPHEKEREAAFMLAWIVVICLAAAAIYRAGYVLNWW